MILNQFLAFNVSELASFWKQDILAKGLKVFGEQGLPWEQGDEYLKYNKRDFIRIMGFANIVRLICLGRRFKGVRKNYKESNGLHKLSMFCLHV